MDDAPSGFEWDKTKAASNLAKHGVRFNAVIQVFFHDHCLELDATQPGQGEIRRKMIGVIRKRLFTVVYTLREGKVRIISARKANARETARYRHFHSRSQ